MSNALEFIFDDAGPHRLGGPGNNQGRALLMRLDLDGLESSLGLPTTGVLDIYSDLKSPGYSPEHAGACAVIWLPQGPPQVPESMGPDRANPGGASQLTQRRFSTRPCQILPARRGIFSESQGPWRSAQPADHLLGFPFPEQHNQMELQTELTTRGFYTGRSLEIPSACDAGQVMSGAQQWRLLLQLQSQPDIDLMFGDQGTLYLFVRQSQLEQRDFSSVWQIIQS